MPHEFQPYSETLSPTRAAQDTSARPTQDTSARPTPAQASLMQEEVGQEEVRQAATEPRAAADLGHEEPRVEALARRFQQVSRLHRRRVRRAVWVGAGSALSLMIVNAVALITLLQTERFPFTPMWWMWVLNALVFTACVAYPLRSAHARRALAARLAQYEDVRAVGPLAELLTSSDPRLRRTARVGLLRLLPCLTAADAHWLQPEQRDVLCQTLDDAERQPELAEAVIRAFANVGDSSVLGRVQRVAEMRAPASRHKLLKATARECLPLLRARVQHEGARQTLLRPRDTPHSDPATLLRGTAAPSDARARELLRPTAPDDVE